MRFSRLLIPIALFVTSAAAAQTLDCPGSASAGPRCDMFHFHVAMYRPDTRAFVEVFGINQYPSQAACDRARDAAMKRNLAVVDWFRRVRNDSQYEPDRFGACHCDMTLDKTNPRYLSDAQRASQFRNAQDVRNTVREKLMDAGVTTDSEIYHDVGPLPAPSPSLVAGPKLVAIPQSTAVAQVANNATDLKQTHSVDTSKPVLASIDLPLIDVVLSGAPAPPPAPQPVASDGAVADTTPTPTSSADAADNFIPYETQRVQNVLKAASTITDDALKSKIFEACSERSQLLSNLRGLIEGSGARSRLADFARSAKSEDERVAFAAKLFGDDIKPHWAPHDAKEMIIEPNPDIDADPEHVLHDNSGKYDLQQRKRALYMLLARTQPTEQQQLWLTTVVDTFLR